MSALARDSDCLDGCALRPRRGASRAGGGRRTGVSIGGSDNAQQLVERRLAVAYVLDARLPQRLHSGCARGLSQHVGGFAIRDHPLELTVHGEHFHDRHSAAVAGLRALRAADAFIQRHPGR